MFGWFKKKKVEKDPSVFKPEERWIYTFFDGQTNRKVDPLPIYKAITSKGTSLAIDMKVASSLHSDNVKAHTAYIAQVREIFNIKPYADGGLEEREVENLFFHFWDFVDKDQKKNTKPTLTIATVPLPSTESTLDANPHTPNGSDSGSTSNESDTSKPKP